MKAIQIQRFGEPPEGLKLLDTGERPLASGEVRVRIQAAGINPSDLANARGAFPQTTLPRIMGRDFAGEVIEGPSSVRGLAVWGTGGDIGYTRDGTHAEMIDIPLEAVSEKPGNLSPEEAAVVGVPYSTAFTALENTRLSAGEWVIVTGAAGAVGSAAVELVHARGAYSIGLVRNAQERESVDPKMVSAVASTEAGDLEEVVRKATGGKGADVALNGIGASVAPAILSSLNHGGRMAVYSVAFGGRDMQLDLFALYRKRLEIMGVDTASFGVVGGAAILNQLKPLFEKGLLDRPKIAAKYALDDFAAAYARVRQGGGKIVFTMNPTAS